MKKSNLNRTPDVIPQDFSKKMIKLSWLLSIWIPLISVSALSLITSIIKVNFGLNGLYYAFLRITDACAQLSFFGVLAVLIVLIYLKDKTTLYFAISLEAIGLLVVSFAIKILMIVLMALIDEIPGLSSIGIYVSDYTITTLIDNGHIYEVAIIAFLSILGLALMLCLTLWATKLVRDNQKKRRVDTSFAALRENSRKNPMNVVFAIVLSVYALYALINEIVETYRTVIDMDYAGYAGVPNVLSEYVYLVTPYLYVLLYTVCGYYVLRFISSFCTAALVEKEDK